MTWDDDPAQGVVRGNRFLHPDLRLEFSVPQGYGIQNGSSAVSITGSNGQAQFSGGPLGGGLDARSEEHTSELQSLMRISYAVFCLKKKKEQYTPDQAQTHK